MLFKCEYVVFQCVLPHYNPLQIANATVLVLEVYKSVEPETLSAEFGADGIGTEAA